MDNLTIVKDQFDNEYVIIDNGNETFTSMLKSTYEAQQAAQVEHLTEIISNEAASK